MSGEADTIRKPLARASRRQLVELGRRPEAVDRRVLGRGLQVLADGQEIDVGGAQVVHHLQDLLAVSPRPTIRPDLVNIAGSISFTRDSRRSEVK